MSYYSIWNSCSEYVGRKCFAIQFHSVCMPGTIKAMANATTKCSIVSNDDEKRTAQHLQYINANCNLQTGRSDLKLNTCHLTQVQRQMQYWALRRRVVVCTYYLTMQTSTLTHYTLRQSWYWINRSTDHELTCHKATNLMYTNDKAILLYRSKRRCLETDSRRRPRHMHMFLDKNHPNLE